MQNKDLATNTIGHKIMTLKTFLNDATDRGFNTNMIYKKFKSLKEDTDEIYLSENELNKIYKYDFSDNKRLEKVRDIFIIACYSGLRYSDLKNLTDYIKDNKIQVIQQKTGNKVIIPLHPFVKEILQRYNNEMPKIITNQKFNDYIKEVCGIVGIKEIIEKRQTKGGVKKIERMEKYKAVSTHTARRSFATNLYLQGIQTRSIMEMTGHKTETAFLTYIKVSPDQHAQIVDNHWKEMYNTNESE